MPYKSKEVKRAHDKLSKRSKRFVAESFSDDDRVDIDELLYEGDFIIAQVNTVVNSAKEEFKAYCRSHDMTLDSCIEEAYLITKRGGYGLKRGLMLEKAVRQVLLNLFEGTDAKLYKQVPVDFANDNCALCRRIDFVVTKQDCLKNQIDLSQAIVISCKTSLDSNWREDESLFSRCKLYIMVSLDERMPRCQLPSNVLFAKPNVEPAKNIINLNDLSSYVEAYL